MKRLLALLPGLLILALLFGCAPKDDNRLRVVSSYLGADCTAGRIVDYTDTHGGMQGDGWIYAVIDFKGDPFADDSRWRPLPASANTASLLWDGVLMDVPVPPQITEGKTLFRDRHDDADEEADDSDLFSRSSINASVGLFDTETNRLYVIVYDS